MELLLNLILPLALIVAIMLGGPAGRPYADSDAIL
jgi:hypothetical protein